MSDEYTWNNPHSLAANSIGNFLKVAGDRIDQASDLLPFKPEQGHLVLGWMRALLDKRPSELANKP